MTKKQKRLVIYKAAELIEKGVEEFSCCAIDTAAFDGGLMSEQYANFYNKDPLIMWGFIGCYTEGGRKERIIALLLFAEAGL